MTIVVTGRISVWCANSNKHMQKQIKPRSRAQEALVQAIDSDDFVIAVGFAGTGKTLLTIYEAVKRLKDKDSKIRHITIIRPFVRSCLENDIGALPGTVEEKMAPLGACVVDNLKQFLNGSELHELMKTTQSDGTPAKPSIEFVPVSLLRGRTFNNEFVIVEEAQNLRRDGVYSIMSRIGENSKCVFCGDLMQSDLTQGESDLKNAIQVLTDPPLRGVSVVRLYDQSDIQRHKLLYKIMERFNKIDPELVTGDPFGAEETNG